jgi:hypothetical protein
MKNNKMNLHEQLFKLLIVAILGGLLGHFHGRMQRMDLLEAKTITLSFLYSRRPNAQVISVSTSDNSNTTIHAGINLQQRKAVARMHFDQVAAPTGWRDIHVFAGDTWRHLDARAPTQMEQGRNERIDQLVLGLLRNKQRGFFVDLAAGDAIEESNTLGLEITARWNGLCIEPNPVYWYGLSYYRNCTVVAAVVAGSANHSGLTAHHVVEFQYSNYDKDFFGGGVPSKFDQRRKEESIRDIKLQFAVPLLEILQVHHVPRTVDYLSLNIGSGAEDGIFQLFPWSEYTFSIMTLFDANVSNSFRDGLPHFGYQLLKNISGHRGTTDVWAHESAITQLDLTVLNLK